MILNEKCEEIKQLTNELEKYCIAYYKYDKPLISDQEYDRLYDKLDKLEKQVGFSFSNSPTQKVKGYLLDEFKKIKHNEPMLSAKKTKLDDEVKDFIGNKSCVFSYKLDGLTIVLRYSNGELKQAITRGDGEIGEDVTENAKMFKNIPLHIDNKNDLEIRGEALMSWETFNKLIELPENEEYSHPRNLAAGSVRQLNTNITKERGIEFYAFELISYDGKEFGTRKSEYSFLSYLGFDVVPFYYYDPQFPEEAYDDIINKFQPDYKLPVDGIIIRYDDVTYAKSLGRTSHHPLDMIARKWKDQEYETILRDIEWATSKNGAIYPRAIFDTVVIDGAKISKATLHNIDYIKNLEIGIGDTIVISKRNMIIPAVEDNLTRSNSYKIPTVCPTCGAILNYKDGSTTYLYCSNDDCSGKFMGKLEHFVSKKALNIDGVSISTLSKFVELGYISCFKDVFYLSKYKDEIINLDGFGERSYEKMITAIEESRNTTLDKFICSLSIPLIGRTNSKIIAEWCEWDLEQFIDVATNGSIQYLDGCGEKMCEALIEYLNKHKQELIILSQEFNFIKPEKKEIKESIFTNKTFCITGGFSIGSRDELREKIEGLGGKFVSSVSKKTGILVAGEKAGSKLTKATDLGIQIITEEELKSILKES
jgi:DNA ligase (NAD+)